MMRDVILAIRADEAHHRYVNHTLGTIDKDKPNPFGPGEQLRLKVIINPGISTGII